MTTTTSDIRTRALHDALHQLAAAAAHACDDRRTRAVLAVVVQHLEAAAGSELGASAQEPFVVLQRRLGRAHRLLAAATRPVAALDVDHVRGLARALDGRPPAGRRADVVRAGAVALAGC